MVSHDQVAHHGSYLHPKKAGIKKEGSQRPLKKTRITQQMKIWTMTWQQYLLKASSRLQKDLLCHLSHRFDLGQGSFSSLPCSVQSAKELQLADLRPARMAMCHRPGWQICELRAAEAERWEMVGSSYAHVKTIFKKLLHPLAFS
ncbi:unnamed protein product [Durusdinium trenchii]|uniref:Uncharacterized protein n=1 Tax=Durusdinium trenchii TaxID=1381693 RepID=A0ABP0MQH9_9DINO